MKWLVVTNLGVIKVNAETREEAEQNAQNLLRDSEEVQYILSEDELP